MLLTMVAALSLIGCTKDRTTDADGGDVTPEDDGNYVYVSAAIALPSTGTRSSTDKDAPDGTDDNDLTNSDLDKDTNISGKDQDPQEDFEYGYEYENDVRSMILLIANEKDEYIAHTVVKGISQAPAAGQKFDFIVNGEIKHSALKEAYDNGRFGDVTNEPSVHIYAYCNYTGRLLDSLSTVKQGETRWINLYGEVKEGPSLAGHTPAIQNTIWASRSFLMTNAEVFSTKFPKNIDGWSDYADKNSPYDLNEHSTTDATSSSASAQNPPIRVERAAARIDFYDASDKKDRVYALKLPLKDEDKGADTPQGAAEGDDDSSLNLFSVQLTRMSLVNMSNKFYYLRRVSDDGTNGTVGVKDSTNDSTTGTTPTPPNCKVGGRELWSNYVVDVDFAAKQKPNKAGGVTAENASDYFNFPLFGTTIIGKDLDGKNVYSYDRAKWYSDNISDILNNKTDTWSGNHGGEYHIWRYVTENALPADGEYVKGTSKADEEFANQQTVQSTGIVFKGAIIAGTDVDKMYDVYVEKKGDNGATTWEKTEDTESYVSQEVQDALKASGLHLPHDSEVNNEDVDLSDADKKTTKYDYPVLYSFNNMLYADVPGLVLGAAREGTGDPLYLAVESVLKNWYADTANKKFVYKSATDTATAAAEETTTEVQLTVAIYYDILRYQEWVKKQEDAEKDQSTVNGEPIEGGDTEADEEYKDNETEYYDWDVVLTKTEKLEEGEDADNAYFMEHAASVGLTVYKVSDEEDGEGWGYYCYYFYWNRHNDNLKSGEMGRMEFATVRNNVYKLSVTKIGQLGHPRNPKNDPDPVIPEDPDEDPTHYIQVQVEVLPWVVRVNEIEF